MSDDLTGDFEKAAAELTKLVDDLATRFGIRAAQHMLVGALHGLLEQADHPEMESGPAFAAKFLRDYADNIEQEGKP